MTELLLLLVRILCAVYNLRHPTRHHSGARTTGPGRSTT